MRSFARRFICLLACIIISSGSAARAQIFVASYFGNTIGAYTLSGATLNPSLISVTNPLGIAVLGQNIFVSTGLSGGEIKEYTGSGSLENGAFISGLYQPSAILIDGGNLYEANYAAPPQFPGSVGLYTTSGGITNSSLVTGLSGANALALSGNALYVSNSATNSIGEYDATTGAAIHATLISGLSSPHGLAISGNDLFEADYASGKIEEFNATTGAVINSSLITGLTRPTGVEVENDELYVLTQGSVSGQSTGAVGIYSLTGQTINASLISGLNTPIAFTVDVPEPSPGMLFAVALVILFVSRLFLKKNAPARN